MRKFLLWMHASENAKEISVERRGVWNAGISKQRRKNGSECDPQDHESREASRAKAVKLLDEIADDEWRILRLLPREAAKNAGLHGKIQNGDPDYRDENAARDIAFGVANFSAEMANIVVTPVRVNGVDRRRTQGGEKQPGKVPRSGRIREDQRRLEVCRSAPDEPKNRADN